MIKRIIPSILILIFATNCVTFGQNLKPRVIVTTDGEVDDQASMVRFLLYANEFDIEAIVNSSSQFHWVGGKDWNKTDCVFYQQCS